MRDACPCCGADLTGAKIPQRLRKHFGNATHFSRRTSIYDRTPHITTQYKCPDCKHTWERK